MGIKLSYDIVKDSFSEEGYKLLSDNYINSNTKMEYLCPNGHRHTITWNNWYSTGNRCPGCAGQNKPTIEFIKEEFNKEGYILLSLKYINNRTKLEYICPNNHTNSISWRGWSNGNRCSICAKRKKFTIEEISSVMRIEGYLLLTTQYKDNKGVLLCRCPLGHEYKTTWNKWQRGTRCLYCSRLNKPTYEQVVESFEKENYSLLSTEYINSHTKLKYICSNGHNHSITWSDWCNEHRCAYCYGNVPLTVGYVKAKLAEEDYELLSDSYINNTTKLTYKCKLGHTNTTTFAAWTTGRRCPDCYYLTKFGETNPAWAGGITFEKYCEVWKDKEYKHEIRQRDGHKCLNPYCNSKNPNDLVLHHVNYDKKNCHFKNLITVCRSCNNKANIDRDWHQDWYQAVLYRRYKYLY